MTSKGKVIVEGRPDEVAMATRLLSALTNAGLLDTACTWSGLGDRVELSVPIPELAHFRGSNFRTKGGPAPVSRPG